MRERGGTQKQFRTGARELETRKKNRGTRARGTQRPTGTRAHLPSLKISSSFVSCVLQCCEAGTDRIVELFWKTAAELFFG